MVRYKNRYIVAEINPETPVLNYSEFNIAESAICSAIWGKVQLLHGDFGAAAISNGLVVKYWNSQLRTVLIRVRHGPHRLVTSSLPFVDRISDKKVVLNMLYIGGTMRNCYKFIIKHHKKSVFKDLVRLKGTDEFEKLYKSVTQVKPVEHFV